MKYSKKLQDPRWQKKRLKILERDNFKCVDCDDDKSTLNIHHIAYHKEPWDCPDELLITLCEDCHKEETEEIKKSTRELVRILKNCGYRASEFIDLAFEYLKKSKIIKNG